jgi:hypothetical protein
MSICIHYINSIRFCPGTELAPTSFQLIQKLNRLMNETENKEFYIENTKNYLETIKFCYAGSRHVTNPLSMRPVGFIGPLGHIPLPDSLERRILQVVSVILSCEDFYDFLLEIPGIKLIQPIRTYDRIIFPGISHNKDCVDEALKKEDFYQKSRENFDSYKELRKLALRVNSPIPLLTSLGYESVSEPSIGDLVIYFSNIPTTTTSHYSEEELYAEEKVIEHYGRVCEIKKDGTIFVRSKFGPNGGIYEHRIDLIPYYYGNSYLIYSKK